MALFAVMLFTFSLSATIVKEKDIPDGWSYYAEVKATNQFKSDSYHCTVIRANICGETEYKICHFNTWYPVHSDSDTYYFYDNGGIKYTFRM